MRGKRTAAHGAKRTFVKRHGCHPPTHKTAFARQERDPARSSSSEVCGDVKAIERCSQRELAPQTTLLVASVGVTGELPGSLIYLYPSRLDVTCSSKRSTDVVCPHVCSESIMRIVGHLDHFVFVVPRNYDRYRTEDFLPCDAPFVAPLRKNRRPQKITGTERLLVAW